MDLIDTNLPSPIHLCWVMSRNFQCCSECVKLDVVTKPSYLFDFIPDFMLS